jgi:predicted nucleic acid-binding protein
MGSESIAVPAHFDAEVLAVIRRFFRRGELELGDAHQALWRLAQLPAERIGLPPLLGDAFSLSDRFSAHDALYVALAVRLRARVVTLDAGFARAARDVVDISLITA